MYLDTPGSKEPDEAIEVANDEPKKVESTEEVASAEAPKTTTTQA